MLVLQEFGYRRRIVVGHNAVHDECEVFFGERQIERNIERCRGALGGDCGNSTADKRRLVIAAGD